jgi:hypothetical protein
MTETGDALRATSDALLRDLDVLATLEEQKREIVPGDPRLVELAEQIESIAARILGESASQRELSKRVQRLTDSGSAVAPDETIAETARPVAAVLAEWREAERRLAATTPGSVDEAEARLLVDRLRTEYGRAHDAARQNRRGS